VNFFKRNFTRAGKDAALRRHRPRSSGRSWPVHGVFLAPRCAAERGADGVARHPYPVLA